MKVDFVVARQIVGDQRVEWLLLAVVAIDVSKVPHHVGEQARLLGEEHRNQSLPPGVFDHASGKASLAHASHVAIDEALSVLVARHRHRESVNLLG